MATQNDMTTDRPKDVAQDEAQQRGTDRGRAFLQPAVDVVEDARGITVLADVPGVNAEGLDVHVEGDTLLIEGTSNLALPQGAQPLYAEQRSLAFRRRFSLSGDLDTAGIEARLTNGVLQVRIPKTAAAQPRRIEIQAG